MIELGVDVKRSARDLTFTSIESEAVLVLLGHLPGHMQDKIETSINEVRQEICIRGVGDKASLDMAIGGRLRLKSELESNSFEKVFGIPDGVALDQIEVCFDEEDAILMILMPKSIDIEGEVGEIGSHKVDEDELNRNGLETNTHREEDEEMKNEEVDESNKKFDLPQRPSVEIETPNIGEQLPPSFGVKAKGEQRIEEKHNGQPLKEDESSRTSEVSRAIEQPKIFPNIDKEQEDKKGGLDKSHELDNNPIDEKGLPQQFTEELEMSNEDKLPMKEVKGNGREMEKGEVGRRETGEINKEREASEVNQTLGHPKISQNIDKEHEEELEKHIDRKSDAGKSHEIKEEDEDQVRELDNKPIDEKGLPQQLTEELEASNKDKLPMKEAKDKERKKEKGEVSEREASEVNQTLGHSKISQDIDKEHEEELEKHVDRKSDAGKSHEIKEEDEDQVRELDNKPIDEKGLPQQLTEKLEASNKDKLPMKEAKDKERKKEKGEVSEREASEVNQTLGHPKIPRRKSEQGGFGVPPPSLVVSAFLVSLAALVIKLVRNQKRT